MAWPEKKAGQGNPFNITQAVDFSDEEIENYWVDIPAGQGFLELAKPTSRMPMYILGGKGSGKTHLMRYLSYPLQKIRHKNNLLQGLISEGYIGIYFRCGGLNAARFSGKGIHEEVWQSLFAYYMELWLGQLILETMIDLTPSFSEEVTKVEESICNSIVDLFDSPEFEYPATLLSLARTLHSLQKKVNSAVNNSSITRSINVRILATPGELTFGIPRVIANNLNSLSGLQFLYLIDEFENLGEAQQKYVNTVYRERKNPCSFKIGSKLFGVRTHETYSAGEENKEGSEFETLYLDASLRKTKRNYSEFAQKLCEKRLTEAGYPNINLSEAFYVFPTSDCFDELVQFLYAAKEEGLPQYFEKLKKKLELGMRSNVARGVESDNDIAAIIKNLQVPGYPFVEKANTFLLYQDWYSGKNLLTASSRISESVSSKTLDREPLDHFKGDLLAQLVRESKNKQLYLGFDTFVKMSDGLPRNLLIILKHIFKWAVFNGEMPFQRGERISVDSQRKGVREASDWFYHDARTASTDAELMQSSISRLATLFRQVRYSDKPSECSISAFSADLSSCSERSRQTIDLAEKWSLLILIEGGQRDRNSKRVDAKYQINSMLAPRWDLPVSRRGALALRADEINSIFDPAHVAEFETLLKDRIDRMTAPFFGKSKAERHVRLPGFEEE